jgi:integrase
MADGITLQPSGRYRWRVQIGSRRLNGTADTLVEAIRDRAQASLDAGGEAPKNLTVRELLAMRNADVEHAETTAERRDQALALVPAAFLDREAVEVSPVVVRALWRQMAAAGTGAHTIIKASHALSAAFQRGIELEMVTTNPIRSVRPKVPPADEIVVPPVADVRDLLAAVSARADLSAWLRFMAVVGARPGEICGLQWDDLDVDRSMVWVSRSINRRRSTTPGKNRAKGHRWVRLDLPTFTALRRVERVVGCPWIFTHDGRQPWRPQGAALEVRRAIKRINVERARTSSAPVTMRPYDLRHFAATQALRAGVPVHEVAKMLGDNPATVSRVYAHAIPAESTAAAAVAAVLDG